MKDIRSILSEGCPVDNGIVIPWGIPIEKTVSYGNPKVTQWKRWQDLQGRMTEVNSTRVQWKLENLPFLSSLDSAVVEFKQPHPTYISNTFRSIKYYFNDGEAVEKELVQSFGDPIIEQTSFFDRGAESDSIRKLWKPLADNPLRVVFSPGEALLVLVEEG